MLGQIKIKQLIGLVGTRGVGVLIQMLMQFAVARLAGAAGLGLMQLSQTWVCVLGEGSALGLPTEMLKNTARNPYREQVAARLKKSILSATLLWFVALALVMAARHLLLLEFPVRFELFLAVSFGIYSFSILRIATDTLKALDKAEIALFFENALMPLVVLMVAAALVMGWFVAPAEAVGEFLVFWFVAGLALAAMASVGACACCIKCLPESPTAVSTEIFSGQTAYFCGTAMIAIGFLNLPYLVMPYFASVADVGRFALAFKLINPITTLLIMLSAVYGPRFAQRANDKAQLRRLLRQSQVYSLILYVPFLALLLVFSEPLLRLFGEDFLSAKPYLLLLGVAQLVNAATGLSANLLNMAGLGDREFLGSIVVTILAVAGSFWAGHLYGPMGVATAFALALVLKNICSYVMAILFLHSSVADVAVVVR